jgi:predicted adenylyl cyclase CyaB
VPRNVEIKARLADREATRALVMALVPRRHEKLAQLDTFFRVPRGRLKLRKLGPARGELIYYERDDAAGPKLSRYAISACENPDELAALLGEALGVRGEVAKERDVYLVGQTRIHVDSVQGLGDFLELEVVLGDAETAEHGEAIARDLLRALAVPEEALVAGAYADLLFGGA